MDSFWRVKVCFWRLGEVISIGQCSLVRNIHHMLNRGQKAEIYLIYGIKAK